MADAWDPKILESMKPGCVTFAWDDGEVRTVETPGGTLDEMKSAWAWIDGAMNQFAQDKGRPRSICFKLSNGQFRGLKFPDWQPGAMD
ncbi:MAG TPA: hypothetical protein VK463_14680 [Desulfomonilaceae bacterium]|nr:hypothetical protein [Desulfomonilaceae bacterium]